MKNISKADYGVWVDCQSAWRPDDKEWIAKRKVEWRLVEKNLDLLNNKHGGISKRLRKHHKDLFFKGTIYREPLDGSGSPFAHCQLFFLMWYYPESSEEVFRSFCGAPQAEGQLRTARDMLLDYSHFATGNYGMLGGREELFVNVLIPELDCGQELIFEPHGIRLDKISPRKVFSICLHNTRNLLLSKSSEKWPNPYSVGQYLWDQMDYVFEHSYGELSYIDEYGSNNFLFADLGRQMPSRVYYLFDLMVQILDFDEREGAPRDNPAARNLRERLIKRFETRDFGPRLMAVWDEAKAHYESGSKEPLWGLF